MKKNFIHKFFYLMDSTDKKNFSKFIILLLISGMLALLGIGAVIPFINILIHPEEVQNLPLIHLLDYKQAVATCVGVLIAAYWIKNLAILMVLKKQSTFLNNFAAKIQAKLFRCYIHSPYVYHVKRSSPELVSNINVEVNQLSSGIIGQVGNLLTEVVTSTIVFIFLLFINPIFSLIVGASVVIAARVFMMQLRRKAQYYGSSRSANYRQLTQTVVQAMGGVKETKIYQKEQFFTDSVQTCTDNIAKAQSFLNVFQLMPRLLIEVVSISVIMVLMLVFVLVGYSGSQIVVLLTVFGVAAVQLLPSMNRLMQAVTSIKYCMPALNKVYSEFKLSENYMEALTSKNLNKNTHNISLPFKQLLKLKNISFAYDAAPILSGIDLEIAKGQRVAFVGASGAGKTTLVDIILGILTPSQGEIWVDDQQITRDNLTQWQSHFGYIPQMIYLYDCSLRENIAFGVASDQIDDAQVWNCLQLASLETFVKEQPDGLNAKVGENGIQLSGGQRQRIGIARALYHNPDILVMDEATAALDNQTEAEVTQALSCAEQGRTIITIAHRLSTIRDYDVIYVLDKGKIVAYGTYDELLKNCERFREMVKANPPHA